ncbi:isochorismatase family protein [Nakamurella sp. PAMC28650]|uniref:isochorismatase family protein n=1 Tax=Nakamurella sp. PAMC28650 TaxID=2762325 RepID=UPI00164CF47A|nr:isochorismatase family protein [Nakamurella sp. PAMC28650]QNK80549.1 isochorismatase family protein [Nakamurella sp. PAMC28650]
MATDSFDSTTALIVVDVQHDFADPSGSLYVKGGEQTLPGIVERIRGTVAAGGLVVYTQDWHPEHTPHFAVDGGLWPVHCVMDTPGAALMPGLPVEGPVVRKGSGPEDGYSGFSVLDLETGRTSGTELSTILDENGIMAITVVGLAGDWCVKATAIDGVALGYRTTVPLSLTRFVELQPGDAEAAVAAMRAAGVTVTD